jgi:1-acyl-sn-glycerol-3-phosphate acyltransferase
MRAPDIMQPLAAGSDALPWRAPPLTHIMSCALPHLELGDRLVLRSIALVASRHVVAIHGLQNIRAAADPFILVANHSTRRESLLVPALLLLHRGGRRVHFLADWNFRLIPGVGFLYARAQVVTITRKPARPRFLNVLKPLYEQPEPTLERARAHLAAGRAIGIFPEGQVNRDPGRLLRGRRGAARLSLEMGVPVVPMGIRFPGRDAAQPVSHGGAAMEIHIGQPLVPTGARQPLASRLSVSAWHATIMTEIARLCGKAWTGAATGGQP